MSGYSLLRNATYSDLFHEFMNYCLAMDMELEQLHNETGPGVMEASIYYDDAIQGADKAVLFKTFSKVFFQKRGIVPTFMAKWTTKLPGQGGHLHHSVWDLKNGKPLFYDERKKNNMSEMMSQFLAGQLKLLKPFFVMYCPTVNSYKRLVKGSWAPTSVSWGIDNRTTAIRVVPGGPASQRLEHRVPAADANPYLVAAAAIASGLYGIEHKLTLDDPVPVNVYDIEDDFPPERRMSKSLRDAAVLFAESTEAKEYFGEEFVEHFATSRNWEVSEYEASHEAEKKETDREEISTWELSRYFELI
jgi:glutamine synthetase